MKNLLLAGLCAASLGASLTGTATAQADNPYLGDIILVGFNFCPRGWAEANRDLLAISQNDALFSLYGTIYGGDGRTTFALPDMRGRVPIGQGQGNGLSNFNIGSRGGASTVTLTQGQMAQHSHSAHFSNTPATQLSPIGHSWANLAGQTIYQTDANTSFDSDTVSNTGGNLPFSTVDPIIAMKYCVATQGIYPSRN